MKHLTKSIFVIMAASLAVSVPISASAMDTLAKTAALSSDSGQIAPELMKAIEKGLEKASRILPYIKEYPVMEMEMEIKDSSKIMVNRYQSKEKKFPVVTFIFDQKTGELLRFHKSTGEQFKSTHPLEKSKENAIAFMKQWYGEDMDGYQLNQAMSDSNFSITFNKMVNGIPFINDDVILKVDSQGLIVGKGVGGNQKNVVVSKQSNLSFTDPKEALSKEQVEKQFASYMKPYYTLDSDRKTYKLLYTAVFSGEIDARTGKDRSVGIQSNVVQFQPKGEQPTAKTKEEAAAFLVAKTGYSFTKGRAVFEENDMGNGVTNFVWKTEAGVIGSIFVEKVTGKITNYQVLDTNHSKAEKKLSPEDALKIAVTEMSSYLKPDVKEMMLLGTDRYKQYDKDQNLYMFNFSRIHHGIPVEHNMAQAYVDASTGKVLLLDWRLPEKAALPNPEKIISPEEAAKIYLKYHPLELYYSFDDEKEGKEGTVSLVYLLILPLSSDYEPQVDGLTAQPYYTNKD